MALRQRPSLRIRAAVYAGLVAVDGLRRRAVARSLDWPSARWAAAGAWLPDVARPDRGRCYCERARPPQPRLTQTHRKFVARLQANDAAVPATKAMTYSTPSSV